MYGRFVAPPDSRLQSFFELERAGSGVVARWQSLAPDYTNPLLFRPLFQGNTFNDGTIIPAGTNFTFSIVAAVGY